MDESNLNELKDIIFNLDVTVDKKSCMVIFTETSDCVVGQFSKIEIVIGNRLNVNKPPVKIKRLELTDPIAINLIKRYVNTKQLFTEIIQLGVPNFIERKTNNLKKLRTDCTAELVHKDFLEIIVEYRVVIRQS
jgi:hypothetical protein